MEACRWLTSTDLTSFLEWIPYGASTWWSLAFLLAQSVGLVLGWRVGPQYLWGRVFGNMPAWLLFHLYPEWGFSGPLQRRAARMLW